MSAERIVLFGKRYKGAGTTTWTEKHDGTFDGVTAEPPLYAEEVLEVEVVRRALAATPIAPDAVPVLFEEHT